MYFDVNALHLPEEEKNQIYFSEIMQPNAQVPGRYPVKILVNSQEVMEEKIDFIICNGKLCPELTVTLLNALGVKSSVFPALVALGPTTKITELEKYIPNASANFDFSAMALNLSIPQAAMVTQARGDISPEQWDDGLTMAFINYNSSGFYEKAENGLGSNGLYLSLRSGANIGPWRVRNYSYYNQTRQEGSGWQSLQTFVERDIRYLRARLSLGEIATNGLVFDRFNFKGVSLASDSEMLPESQRGFAPVIRGVAMSNAQVEVWQKDNLLYQTFVSPGEFTITDLYPTASSGDLRVVIHEENGNERTFVQPFSAAPTMVRQGQVQFAVSSGEYHSDGQQAKSTRFVQTEAVYGVLNGTTFYAGTIGAENYGALSMGVGQSLGIAGALSFDITSAKAKFEHGNDKTGQSYQFRYSKNITETNTTMTLAGYRYTTENYYSFADASDNWRHQGDQFFSAPKNRMQVIMGQSLGSYGHLSLSGYQQDYWKGNRSKTRSFMGSYNISLANVSLGVSYSNNRSWSEGQSDKIWALNMSMPLSRWLPASNNSAQLSYNMTQDNHGRIAQSSMLSGTALADRNLNYSLVQGFSRGDQGQDHHSSSAASVQYTDSRAIVTAGYANNYGNSQRVNFGVQGAIIAHPYGVTLAQNFSDDGASALVQAPGAGQVKIDNSTGLYTDDQGYAIVPYLSPYRVSSVMLNSEALPENIDVANTNSQVTPSKGALALADFKTRIGNKVFLTLNYRGGKVPFGSIVNAGDGVNGIVNENSEVFLSGASEQIVVKASWGEELSCSAPMDLSKAKKSNGIALVTLSCQ
jgi:outer membrane usher protein